MIAIKPFIEVYGTSETYYTDVHFIAVKFTKPILIFKNASEVIPHNSILLVQGELPNPILTKNCYIFQTPKIDNPFIQIGKIDLYLSLFPKNSVIHHTFSAETFFAVTTINPFSSYWHTNSKNRAYRALRDLYLDMGISRKRPTPEHIALFRHFNCKKPNLKNFSSWVPLAKFIFQLGITNGGFFHPNAQFGSLVDKIVKRSVEMEPGPLPPNDFYQCELMLGDEFLGIVCYVDPHFKLKYISPLIVSCQKKAFNDVNRVCCNYWFPLYRCKENWKSRACMYYIINYDRNVYLIHQVLSLLEMAKSEKYQYMRMDLSHALRILTGEGGVGAKET